MDALIIKEYWLNLILSGEKKWEMRGSKTHKRGVVGLIQSGSGQIKGEGNLVDCIGPLSEEEFQKNRDKHYAKGSSSYKKTYAWVFEDVKRYETPIPYKHPQGAIIWVKV